MKKTNAARLLDQAKIKYELVPYECDPDNLAATHVAEELGEDVRQVFKTIVMVGDRTKHFVCVVPGDKEIDLKTAAKASGNKKCETLPLKELLPLTGYIRGGCSPIGMRKLLPTYIDITAREYPFIFVSAGIRGLQLKLSPTDLAQQVQGTFLPLTHE